MTNATLPQATVLFADKVHSLNIYEHLYKLFIHCLDSEHWGWEREEIVKAYQLVADVTVLDKASAE